MRSTSKATILSILAAAFLLSACGASEGGSGEAPRSVLAGEQERPPGAGEPRPGGAGLVRTADLTVGGVSVTAEIADTPALRERGLMGRDSLPENHGMLFVYADEQVRSFWMRSTPIALDIAFADRNGSILNVETMEPNSDESWLSSGPAMYALEMRAGWFEANAIGAGASIQF